MSAISPRDNTSLWGGYKIIDKNVDSPTEAQCIICTGHEGKYAPILDTLFSPGNDYIFLEDCSARPPEQLRRWQIRDYRSKKIVHIQGWDHPDAEKWAEELGDKNQKIFLMTVFAESGDIEQRKEGIVFLGAIYRKTSNNPIEIAELTSAINSPSLPDSKKTISLLVENAKCVMKRNKTAMIIRTFSERQQCLIDTINRHLNCSYKIFIFVGKTHVIEKDNYARKDVDELKKVLHSTRFCIFQECVEKIKHPFSLMK